MNHCSLDSGVVCIEPAGLGALVEISLVNLEGPAEGVGVPGIAAEVGIALGFGEEVEEEGWKGVDWALRAAARCMNFKLSVPVDNTMLST